MSCVNMMPYLIVKNGSEMDSLRQMGHFPGFRSLSLFLKEKPHFLHFDGTTTRVREV